MTTPITVIGGYLGAGKTTVLNSLLQRTTRRVGVIVNDFGDVGIDARLVQDALEAAGRDESAGDVPVVNLANGCVCCTLSEGLHATLDALAALRPALDHIVIEASGVADPATAAAWGTVPPFRPGGVVVLAAADSVRRQADDRYVGSEVRRQIAGADIVVLTKTDVCTQAQVEAAIEWLSLHTAAPVVRGELGDVPLEVIFGEPEPTPSAAPGVESVSGSIAAHGAGASRYRRWRFDVEEPVERAALDRFLSDLPGGVLRLKGFVSLAGPTPREVVVQVVGATVDVGEAAPQPAPGTERSTVLTAIGLADVLDVTALDGLARQHLGHD